MTHLHIARTRKALLAALTLLIAAAIGLGLSSQAPSIAGSAGDKSKAGRESSIAGSKGEMAGAGRDPS
jgi:hypothetical protein